MSIPAGGDSTSYTTTLLVKKALGKITDDDRDELIEDAVESASRMIDDRCGRHFYLDATATARTYQLASRSYLAASGYAVVIDDIGSDDGLVVETGSGATWATLDAYLPAPDNALARGRPINTLTAVESWGGATAVRVTARWGWPAVPRSVQKAALLLALRLYRRKDSPQGVITSPDWGAVRVSRIDPDVEALIASYVIPGFA